MAQISDNSIDYKSWKTNIKYGFVLNNNRMLLKKAAQPDSLFV